ncbi:PLD-like domain-containing protein [Treponema bryantii]|uniref:PLD-like domain-containing protein n=1 Tax=Treponema bryantii TaxID=163 RepID=A0A1H9INI7_9SPIR|nr:DEAD/DEAH box helicase [Treponema bryantii]SEQ76183.1 PLD-like domain-containing protein [Treponema bryantii]
MTSLDSAQLLQSLQTGFISKTHHSISELAPSLLINDYHREKKILTSLLEELSNCKSFDFSVAFINNEGLAAIKQKLDELALYSVAHRENPIKGRILTTNYLNFTQPSALRELMQFPNIEIRAYTKGGFHPKGYIFEHSNYYSIIIGSANLTASALTMNQEWSVKFLSCTDGQIVFSVREEFEEVWKQANEVNEEWLKKYSNKYEEKKLTLKLVNKQIKELRKQEKELQKDEDKNPIVPAFREELEETQFEQFTEFTTEIEIEEDDVEMEIVPNSMQEEALVALHNLREENQNRALLIAATGTGKTYLSIFDVKQEKPRKVLYVAHRDMILDKSEKSFKNIFPNIKTGFLNGSQKDIDADYLFASVFTLAKEDTLKSFEKNEFDYIIVDEVHHAGAESYKKVIDYFTPKFLLGLTATPERTDGFDIFSMFHNNIAYEIRLQKAMEEELLCPFHYYGLSDLTVDGEVIDDNSDFSKLICEERIKHIERTINLYRNFAYPVKGLIFCSRIDEAKELSAKLNNDGYYTKYLTGDNSDAERERVIQELESDDNPLQYIISVDIFNEGVDIPSVNQVVMLRPTQSAIIFVQQLGRGLRKYKGKSYVSVIDFIGNYENNFFIPIALYGDNSYNKDNLRKVMNTGSSGLPGTSTVQINEIARQKIYQAINDTNFTQLKLLKEEFNKLKMRLAKIPTMMDFVNNGFIDPHLFIDYAGSYYEFLKKMDREYTDLEPKHRTSLQFISLEFSHGFRMHELLLLKLLVENNTVTLEQFSNELSQRKVVFKGSVKQILKVLSKEYYRQEDQKKYGEISYVSYDNAKKTFSKTESFNSMLQNNLYKEHLLDLLEYGINKATIKENEVYGDDGLVYYRKYSRKDVFKIMNFDKDQNPQNVGGYIIQEVEGRKKCPVFVTYEKAEDISSSTKYKDYFINNTRFNWMSKNKRYLNSPDVEAILNQETNNIQIELFIKKDDNEGTDFYYIGKMKTDYESKEQTQIPNEKGQMLPVVNLQFDIEPSVPQNLYSYLEA